MKYYIKALKQYFDFKGRARRKEYWYFFLFNSIFSVILFYLAVDFPYEGDFLIILFFAYSVLLLIPGIAVAVRRMHDVGKSGWFILIPIYNLILALTKGQVGENRYGVAPKAF